MSMLEIPRIITLDLQKPGDVTVYAAQDDYFSRYVALYFVDGETPIELDGTENLIAQVRLPDGTSVEYDTMEDGSTAAIDIVIGYAVLRLSAAILKIPGLAQVDITVDKGDPTQLTSFSFALQIVETPVNDAAIAADSTAMNNASFQKDYLAIHSQSAVSLAASIPVDSWLEALYPVGSIFVSAKNANPYYQLGFGTWSKISDRFLVGAGGSYAGGSSGGAAAVTLQFANAGARIGFADSSATAIGDTRLNTVTYFRAANAAPMEWDAAPGGAVSNYAKVEGSQEISNLPPYVAVCAWQRTA